MMVCGRHVTSLLLSNVSHQRIPQSITSAVSSKLSRSDFVQWGKVGNNIFLEGKKPSIRIPAVSMR
jgi:hypothetical protein